MASHDRPSVLTSELIAAAFPRPVTDDPLGMATLTDQDVTALIDRAFRDAPRGGDIWVFAYGALMWKPDFAFEDMRRATALGWHRRFCLWQWRYRGTRERPALMLALDRGGACKGVAYRVSRPGARASLDPMLRRELNGDGYRPSWLTVDTEKGRQRAIGFVANRRGARYAGALPDNVIAHHIATACGHIGPSADYLLETTRACAALGIEDRMLLRLQALVAEKLRTASPPRR